MSTAIEERKAETRDMIIQAARKIFSEKGFHKTQITDIVKEAGISVGSIYAHFHDKRDLFEQLYRENLKNLRQKLRELRQTAQPNDIRERVQRWKYTYNAFFDYVDENPQQILMILRGGFGVDEYHDADLWKFFNAFAQDIAEDYRKWETLGYIRGFNPILMGHITIGMSFHVAHSYLVDKQFTRKEAINNLIVLTHAMLSIYLTDKGKRELGDLSVPQILDGKEV
jgi:AcrR family transcriptional regulator